ncbi:MAG: hypothetical protein Q4F00_13625 [bacterium]|nr:hypothetical protein [bacterium]
MNKLVKTFENNKFTLLVSITRNDVELARIAQEAGADAVKVHINCAHFASGTNFGTWQQEEDNILKIRQALNIPLGIVLGAEEQPSPDDIDEIRQVGFDFWDLFAHHTVPCYFDWDDMGHMVAVNSTWTPKFVENLIPQGVDVIESSIIPQTNYRSRLTAADVSQYAQLVEASSVPIIVPTQKAVRPEEVKHLYRAGVCGIAIGAVVTGLGTEHLRDTVSAFRKAIDEL